MQRNLTRLEHDVARRTEGLPLIAFSRNLSPVGSGGEADWLAQIAVWPLRAWVDPDPRSQAARTPDRQRAADHLQTTFGFRRFPLSDAGIVPNAGLIVLRSRRSPVT